MAFTGYIYRVTNRQNGKVYIGQTIRPVEKRFAAHVKAAREGAETSLARAIRKYGADVFSVETLAIATSYAELLALEIHYIAEHGCTGSGYNMTFGGEGVRGTPEVRAKQSATARIVHNLPEVRARHREANGIAARLPDRRAKLSATCSAPEESARRSARATKQNARLRDHLAGTSAASWKNETVRQARQAGQRAWWANRSPEEREQHRLATSAGRLDANRVRREQRRTELMARLTLNSGEIR